MKLNFLSTRRARAARTAYRPQAETLEGRQVMTTLLGLTDTRQLVAFDSANPAVAVPLPIRGIETGVELWAIDVRPSDGKLYALGRNSATSAGRLYRVDQLSLGSGVVLTPLPINSFTLTSNALDMDFDPVSNRLRVVTRTDQNLSIDPDTGTVVGETNLTFAPGQGLFGSPNVAGIAYNNNLPGVTASTLFAYDWDDNVLLTVGNATGIPPALGQLFRVGDLPAGITPLNEDRVGLDIDKTGTAFLLLNSVSNPDNRLRRLNLQTGATTSIGDIGVASGVRVRDIAVAPEPRVEFAASGIEVDEAAGTVALTLTRSGDAVGAITVNFATADGTAVSPADYAGQSGSITFADGELTKTLVFPIVDDAVTEGAETFTVNLSVPAGSNAVLGARRSATVAIRASDLDATPPTVVGVRGVRVGRGRRAKIRFIAVTYSEAMEPGGVTNLGNYQLRVPGPRKRSPSRLIPLSGATYDAATRTLSLALGPKLKKGRPVSVVLRGAGLRDLAGNLLNGSASDVTLPVS